MTSAFYEFVNKLKTDMLKKYLYKKVGYVAIQHKMA